MVFRIQRHGYKDKKIVKLYDALSKTLKEWGVAQELSTTVRRFKINLRYQVQRMCYTGYQEQWYSMSKKHNSMEDRVSFDGSE